MKGQRVCPLRHQHRAPFDRTLDTSLRRLLILEARGRRKLANTTGMFTLERRESEDRGFIHRSTSTEHLLSKLLRGAPEGF